MLQGEGNPMSKELHLGVGFSPAVLDVDFYYVGFMHGLKEIQLSITECRFKHIARTVVRIGAPR